MADMQAKALRNELEGWRIVGEGWNHEVLEMRGRSQRKRVLHAECHAIADAIRRAGEKEALEAFGQCTAWIVEVRGEGLRGEGGEAAAISCSARSPRPCKR